MAHRSGFGFFVYVAIGVSLAAYFAFAAVQGDLGVFQRIAVNAEMDEMRVTRDSLQQQVDMLSNKTKRLSDSYLDLDLLDERARTVLGAMRNDELIAR